MLAAVQAPALASASQSLPAPAHYSSSGWKRLQSLRATLPPRRRRRTAAPPTAATAASSAASPQAARPGDQYFAGGDVRVRRLVCCLHPAAARSVAFCSSASTLAPGAPLLPFPPPLSSQCFPLVFLLINRSPSFCSTVCATSAMAVSTPCWPWTAGACSALRPCSPSAVSRVSGPIAVVPAV